MSPGDIPVIDFHTHTFFSDGVLVPSELVRRANVTGYRAIGIADHGDHSNVDFIIPRLIEAAAQLNRAQTTLVLPGIEITHTPAALIPDLIRACRHLGAVLVIVHGETIVEPVEPGTNRAAIEGGADILAHPGLITREEAQAAAEKGVYLEITARKGHSLTNGHVAAMCRATGAEPVINTDAHTPDNLISKEMATKVLMGAGFSHDETAHVFQNNESLLHSLIRRGDINGKIFSKT